MQKLVGKRSRKTGAAPGTLVYVGEERLDPVRIVLTEFDAHSLDQNYDSNAEDSIESLKNERMSWVHVTGVHDTRLIEQLGTAVQLHPLVMEDMLNTDQRPKMDAGDETIFVVLRLLSFDSEKQEIVNEQVSLVLGHNWVFSLTEKSDSVFEPIRRRLENKRRVRFMGIDYLFYALIDAIVDNYFDVLEHIGDRIEGLESDVMENSSQDQLLRLHRYKRSMLVIRRAVWPLREVLSSFTRDSSSLITAEVRVFMRDVYDHTVHIMDTVESTRDLLMGLLDLYMSGVSNRMNEVMKVLTTIATIFMPLTFIAGVYGMNFENMPELGWPWAYPVILLLMLAIGIGLSVVFKIRKWL